MAHPAIAAGLIVGGFALFKGYAEPLEEGQTPVLVKGDPVKIMRYEGEEEIIVVKVDDDGNEVLAEGTATPVSERCFADELEPAEVEDEAGEAAEEATEEAEEEAAEEAAETEAEPEAAEEAAPAPKAKAAAKPKAAAAKADTKAKAPAKAKETKSKAIVAKPVVEISDMASVKEALKAEGGDALKAAKALVERAEQTDFTLGGVLHNIHESGVFKTLGFDGKRGFDDYVEKTLDIASRKARYLMGNYAKFVLLGVDEARLNELGWSKVKELARIPDDDLKKDFDKLAKKAKESTRDELVDHIKSKYAVVTRGEQVKLTAFSFRLAEEEANNVTLALKEAATAIGEPNDLNKAFAHICGEWRNTGVAQDLDLEQAVELLVSRFGLQALTFTNADGAVVEYEADASEETIADDAEVATEAA